MHQASGGRPPAAVGKLLRGRLAAARLTDDRRRGVEVLYALLHASFLRLLKESLLDASLLVCGCDRQIHHVCDAALSVQSPSALGDDAHHANDLVVFRHVRAKHHERAIKLLELEGVGLEQPQS